MDPGTAWSRGRSLPARRFGSAKGSASVKFRLSISSAVILFGIIAALGLAGLFVTSGYALKQLRVGGPLYNQIKLGNDLIADVLPPPEYVLDKINSEIVFSMGFCCLPVSGQTGLVF
jgi:hypothetical protein